MPEKMNNRKSGAAAAHKARLRSEAEERQAARAARTTEQQLALLDKRRGLSLHERGRLGG